MVIIDFNNQTPFIFGFSYFCSNAKKDAVSGFPRAKVKRGTQVNSWLKPDSELLNKQLAGKEKHVFSFLPIHLIVWLKIFL